MTTGNTAMAQKLAAERAEESRRLAVAEARYRDLYENAPDLYACVEHGSGIVLDANRRLAEVLGLEREAIIGRRIQEFYTASSRQAAAIARRSEVLSGDSLEGERVLRKADGTRIETTLKSAVVRNEHGAKLYWRSVWRDVTSARQLDRDRRMLLKLVDLRLKYADPDELLARVARRVRVHLQASGCVFLDVVADGGSALPRYRRRGRAVFADVTWPLARENGPALSELHSGHMARLSPAGGMGEPPRFRGAWIAVPLMRSGVLSGVLLLGSATPRNWTAREELLLQSVADRTWLWVEQVRLLQALRASNQELEESAARFQIALELAPVGMVMVDEAGRIVLANAHAEKLWGHARRELIGRPVESLLADGQTGSLALREIFCTRAASAVAVAREVRARCRDGSELALEMAFSVIRMREGRFLLGSAVDITERRRQFEQENFRFREASRLKSRFLTYMSHELRTPLNSIIGFADLMHRGRAGPVSDPHREYLGDILASSRHLLTLINEVLDLARVEAGKLEIRRRPTRVDVVLAEVREAMSIQAQEHELALRTSTDPSLGEVHVDADRVRQILFNYVSNAIRVSPAGEYIDIRARPAPGGALRLEVEDRGPGIPTPQRDRLFVEFERLDAQSAERVAGTGLGLALSRSIAVAHGGVVGIDDSATGGTIFFVELPGVAAEVVDG